MLRSKHLAGLILAAMLTATMVPFSTLVYAQNQENEKAQKFIDMAKEAMGKVEELKAIVEESGIPIPEDTTNLYEDGKTKLNEAELEVAELDPDYDSAVELAKEAMRIFREVYGQLNALLEGEEAEDETEEETGEETEETETETDEGDETEETEETEDPQTLMEAIKQARYRLDKVNGTIEANKDYLTDNAEEMLRGEDGLLMNAKKLLDDAVNALGESDVSTAAHNLGDARKLIAQAFVILKKAAGAMNNERIKGFLTVITKFYNRTTRLVERAVEQGLADPGEFNTELGEIEDLIEHAKDPNTPIKDAIADLIDARIRLESIQDKILERRRGKSE